jgi:dsDNA-specific endonuclease/ATPase MutS2
MNFSIGDKVSAIDEDISGTVIRIENNLIVIETKDGFEMDFSPIELIKEQLPSLSKSIFSDYSLDEVISEKEQIDRKKSIKIKPKERNQPAMEVDLHIHHLTDKPKHLSNYEMLNLQVDTARRQLEFAIKKRIQKIVFIHGVGEGVLKMELETLFSRYNNVKYYDADLQKYGLGATEVYIYQNA